MIGSVVLCKFLAAWCIWVWYCTGQGASGYAYGKFCYGELDLGIGMDMEGQHGALGVTGIRIYLAFWTGRIPGSGD